MFLPTKINPNFGVSLIKKNNKVSICIAKVENGTTVPYLECDKEFPFNNPLITGNAVKIFEFIIETNNFIKRKHINTN